MKKHDRFKNVLNRKVIADDLLQDLLGFLGIANTRLLLQASGIDPSTYMNQLTTAWTEISNRAFDENYKESLNEGDYTKAKRVYELAMGDVINQVKQMVLMK